MPLYTLTDTETGEEHTEYMSMSALDDYLKNNPKYKQSLSTPAIVSGRGMGLRKVDNSFKDLLKEIKKSNSKGTSKATINTEV